MTQEFLRKRSLSGTLWMAGAGAVISLANLVLFAVVARLVQPAAFGAVAFAAVCVEMLRFASLSVVTDAVIRRAEVDDTTNSTAFWTAMLAAAVCVVVCVLVFAPLTEWYHGEGAGWIFAVLALTLLLEAPRCVHEGLLKRLFQYRAIAWRMAAASIGGGLLAILLALLGFGAWALVIQRLATAAFQLVVSWRILPWRPAWRYSLAEAGVLLRFCTGAGGSRVLLLIGDRVPEALIGAFTGSEAVGYYRVGARGLDSISQFVVQPASSVALSALARVDSRQHEEQFLRMVRLVAVIGIPAYFGAGVIAPDFVQLLFGERWGQSAIVMSLLAFSVVPCILLPLIGPLLLAMGQPRLLISVAAVNLSLVGGPVLAASFVSLPAATAAQLLGSYAALFVVVALMSRTLGFSGVRLFKALGPALLAAGVMAVVLVGLKGWLGQQPLVLRLTVLSLSGAGLYAAFLVVFCRDYALTAWREIDPLLPMAFRTRKSRKGA